MRCNGEYPLTDGRANVRLSTDSSRTVTSSNTPDAFGINLAASGSSSEYQWNGGAGYRTEGLSPSGLGSLYSFQKVGCRYYDPTFGCFLTRDTYLDQAPYAYCDGDPVNKVDPTGHWWTPVHILYTVGPLLIGLGLTWLFLRPLFPILAWPVGGIAFYWGDAMYQNLKGGAAAGRKTFQDP